TVGKRAVRLLDDLVDLVRGLQRALNARLVLQHLGQTLERGGLHHVPRRRVLPRPLERGANASVPRLSGNLRCGLRGFLDAVVVVIERVLSHTNSSLVFCELLRRSLTSQASVEQNRSPIASIPRPS